MTRSEAMDEARVEQAAMWWAKFQESEPAAEDVAAWVAWMEEDESNARAFRSMNELALSIRHTRVVAPERLHISRTTAQPRRTLARPIAFAASLLLIVGAASTGALMIARSGGASGNVDAAVYTTPTAAQRELLLADGSRVVLGGASSIATDFSAERRRIRLAAGEAYFEVKHEASNRPFVVDVGIATVHAVGTAFNIRRNDQRVAVTVTEGRVKVDRASGMLTTLAVAAGIEQPRVVEVSRDQQVIVERVDIPLAVAAVDPERATSWQHGRLEFVDEPLDTVIDNVSRYTERPLIADDPRLQAITYTGSFVPEHFDSWLGALEKVFPVEITREGNAVTVRARSGAR